LKQLELHGHSEPLGVVITVVTYLHFNNVLECWTC